MYIQFFSNKEFFSNIVHINEIIDNGFRIQKNLLDYHTKQNQLLVIDCSGDPYNNAVHDFYNQIIKLEYHSDFLMLSSDLNDRYCKNNNIVYHPCMFLFLKKNHKPHSEDIVSNPIRRYKISCLNMRCRPHRIENFIKAKKTIWFDQMLFSFHNLFDLETEQNQQPGLNFASEDILPEFLEILPTLPPRVGNDLLAFHSAHTDTYINFVTETSVHANELFISEKAFKPLISGQFGIWLGCPGLVAYLRSIGFDMFDDYIDHSYDDEPDWHRRIDMIHHQIKQLLELDFEKIFIDTDSRRLYNQQHFYSDTLYRSLTTHLQER